MLARNDERQTDSRCQTEVGPANTLGKSDEQFLSESGDTHEQRGKLALLVGVCLLYTSPSPRD